MKIKFLIGLGCASFILLLQPVLAKPSTMVFKNQRGSILEITRLSDNKIDGYFTTAVASKSCPQAVEKKRPISGYIIGNAITFTIAYPMCESVVSVTGNFDRDQKSIDTM